MKQAMKTRNTAALLALLLLGASCIASCGNAQSENQPVVTEVDSATVTEAVEEVDPYATILDAIPEGTDYAGKQIRMRINTFDQTQYDSELFMKGPDEADGDVVHDAILERNQRVEERLNVEFTYEIVDLTWDNVYPDLNKIIMAGDDVYDLIVDQQYGMLKILTANMLYNIYNCDVNDFSQSYWWDEYMTEIQISNDARYIFAGDYFLDIVEVASAIFFNKAMYQSHYEDPNELYQLAFDGKWTIDELGKYVKEFSKDIDGNGKLEDGDVFAMNLSRNYMDCQVFSSGVTFMTRGADGYPVLNLEDPLITTVMEKIVTNYIEPEKTFNFGTVSGVTEAEYYQNQRKAFADQKLLFLNDYIAAVKDLRNMKDDYGILPIPKMDESVDKYRSVSHDTALVGGIPTTCPEPEKICTVLEALCSMSHNTTMITYFESAMKVKYARDESSSKMIDLLHDSITMSFPYAYASQINNYHENFRTLFDSGKANYSTTYAKKKKATDKAFEKMITAYNEMQNGG
ncbi:MAG: hypothetical protein IKV66_04020 [Clostridia bacterium]|nr:hypothetical protein [Clostridia bacterium]